jgi:hypothetical protein
MRAIVPLLFLILIPTWPVAAAILRVPGDFATLQSAVDAAPAGANVLVFPGVYREHIELRGKAIRLIAVAGPQSTVLDGAGLGTVLSITRGEGPDTLVQGFSIRNGAHPEHAGGVHIEGASPSLRGNVIVDNVGGRLGHGVSVVRSAAARLLDNQIIGNRSALQGNGAGGGGGIGVHGPGAVELRGNRIEANAVTRFSSGGGIYLDDAGDAKIVANLIRGNSARLAGGGIAIVGLSAARIENNLIIDNQVVEPGQGGGVYWNLRFGSPGPALIGNTVAMNVAMIGGGIFADGEDREARIVNNLVLAAPGTSAIDCGDFSDLLPPIVHHNNALGDAGAYLGLCADAALYPTLANLSQAPLIADEYWHLAPGAPGVDGGDDAAAAEAIDRDGRARISDGDGDGVAHVDIGAHEYQPSVDRR